jgi:hypothetical protein
MKKELGTIQALFPMPFAEERVLDESGKVDPCKLDAIAFDQFRHGYYAMGEKAGQAWNAGAALAKAALGSQK